MEDAALKNIWNSYDNVLEKSINLNTHLLEKLQTQKIQFSFRALLQVKIFGMFIGVAYILFLGYILFHHHTQIFFTISVGMVIIITGIATIGYVRHIILIAMINFSKSIADTQKKLSLLQSSIIKHFRILCLQVPFHTIWYIPNDLIANGSKMFWAIQGTVTGLFIIAAIWLFRNISYKNINKKWLQKLIEGDGGRTVSKAILFLNEIEEFKKEIQ
jgi:hypothetical protein